MKFLTMVKTFNPEAVGNPPPELMTAIMQLGMEAGAKMLETGGMSLAGTVATRKGQMTTDGPYAEAKEVMGGYAIYNLESEAESVQWTERFIALHRKHWPEWDGEVTIIRLDPFNMAG